MYLNICIKVFFPVQTFIFLGKNLSSEVHLTVEIALSFMSIPTNESVRARKWGQGLNFLNYVTNNLRLQ